MTRAKSILVVEDESDLADLICLNLEREGYHVRVAHTGDSALEEIRREMPDLVILDRMLPNVSGDDVLTTVRREENLSRLSVIMMTAKAEESDELVGFALGADDYVAKPVSMKVLLARVAAILRRGRSQQPKAISAGPFSLDYERHELSIKNKPVRITATEFRLLWVLMEAGGRILSRGQLVDKVLGHGAVVLDRVIDVHITSLRKKLTAVDPSGEAASWIQTVRGVGYGFREAADD